MTDKQLSEIKKFSLSFYRLTDQFHDERHAFLTVKYAMLIAREYKNINLKILEAACFLHDIGRIKIDEGHPYESAKIAEPFLKKIEIPYKEIKEIIHAVSVHAIKDIHTAKSIEAKILFDADKIQQLSVFGFLRMTFYTIAEKKIDMVVGINSMWERVQKIPNVIQTPEAKKMLAHEMKKIEQIVQEFRKGINGDLK